MNSSIAASCSRILDRLDRDHGAPVALVALQFIGTAGSKAKVATFDLNLDAANAIKTGRSPWRSTPSHISRATSPLPRCGLSDEWQRHRRWAVDVDRTRDGRPIEHG